MLFKGDYLKRIAITETENLHKSKYITSSDYQRILSALIRYEVFDEIEKEMYNLLKELN